MKNLAEMVNKNLKKDLILSEKVKKHLVLTKKQPVTAPRPKDRRGKLA